MNIPNGNSTTILQEKKSSEGAKVEVKTPYNVSMASR
jgi:hypothetical protein